MEAISNTKLAKCPIQLTPGAIVEIKQLIYEKEVPDNQGLRIGVEGGGCSGLTYILGFDEPQDMDMTFELEGIKLLINKAHGMYLAGMEVDYHNGLQNRGFIFNNPNAADTCGCGTSFST